MEEPPITKNVQMSVQLMFPDHTKEFQCPVCAKYFSRKFTLDAHMLIHKGEKPHACPFCGKCFRQKGTLMRHKALHSAKSLFHCSLCNRGFRQKNVFLHHLKHRHNVSTETLDRRKYRTELKDYQSIMDTLPPFVHADSTAIASSEKHLDAMLLQSIDTHVNNSYSGLKCVSSSGSNNILQPNAGINRTGVEVILNNDNGYNSEIHNRGNYSVNCDRIDFNQNYDIHEDYCKSRKPAHNKCFSEVDTTVSSASDTISELQCMPNPEFVSNTSVYSLSANVSSSIGTNDENLTCIPCHLSFPSEIEFKCHMKTHVQSVLLEDLKSKEVTVPDLDDTDSAINSKDYLIASGISSVQFSSNKKPENIPLNAFDEVNLPIKREILDFNSNSLSLENISEYVVDVPKSINNFKCPICRISFKFEDAFREHSKSHSSYSLLKFICALYEGKKCFSTDETFNPVFDNMTSSGEKCLPNNVKSDKCLLHKDTNSLRKCYLNNKTFLKKASKITFLKRLTCLQCDKKFANKYLFEYHRQLHLSPKGFKCKCCQKKFFNKKLLLRHTNLHHLKTYACSNCTKVFNYRSLLYSHRQGCMFKFEIKNSNGSNLNFPLINMESLLGSNTDGIIGVIPVSNSLISGENNSIKVGIPIMSISHIKALYSSCKSGLNNE